MSSNSQIVLFPLIKTEISIDNVIGFLSIRNIRQNQCYDGVLRITTGNKQSDQTIVNEIFDQGVENGDLIGAIQKKIE